MFQKDEVELIQMHHVHMFWRRAHDLHLYGTEFDWRYNLYTSLLMLDFSFYDKTPNSKHTLQLGRVLIMKSGKSARQKTSSISGAFCPIKWKISKITSVTV